MSYRYGDREQMGLFPQSIEDYVKSDDPVRAYDAIVESLDFSELGIELGSDKVGIGIGDEIYQHFLHHRYFTVYDIFLNILGGILGLLIFWGIKK